MSRNPIDFLLDIEEDVPVLLKRVQEMIASIEES